jgi:DNA-binding response OmpR family regulator
VQTGEDPDISVLVVGDEARATARQLRSSAMEARGVRGCDQAVTLLGLSSSSYDVVLLTRSSGSTHVREEIRRLRDCVGDGLLFVHVGGHVDESVAGALDAGADDYVTDPLTPVVLAARIRARRRRTAVEARTGSRGGVLGDLLVDRFARRCAVGDQEIGLRAKEFDLLDTLVSNAGRVVSRSALMSLVWDEHWFRSTKTLDVTMVGLRRRLRESAELAGAEVPEITTIRGVGYRLDPPRDAHLASAMNPAR